MGCCIIVITHGVPFRSARRKMFATCENTVGYGQGQFHARALRLLTLQIPEQIAGWRCPSSFLVGVPWQH